MDFAERMRMGLRGWATGKSGTELRRDDRVEALLAQLSERVNQPGFSAANSPVIQELMVLDPAQGATAYQNFSTLSKQRRSAMAQDALKVKMQLGAGNTEAALATLDDRIAQIQKMNGDASETMAIRQAVAEGDTEFALEELNAFLEVAEMEQLVPRGVSKKAFAPIMVENDKGEKRYVIPKVGPDGAVEVSEVDMPEGFSPVKETGEEARLGEIEMRRKLDQDKSRRAMVDRGTLAAESMANLKRAVHLLDLVETGGVDAWKIAAQQFFGVEGADAGELSANLGKAVLSQLRETFGAAFTAQEGDRLARIEAGMRRNPETNKRLLANALAIADRAARRGLKAAQDLEDEFSVEDIEALLAFELNPDEFLRMRDQTGVTNEDINSRIEALEAKAGAAN